MGDDSLLYLGNACNNHCWSCPIQGKEPPNLRHLDEIKKQIERCKSDSIIILGGEPTIHPNFFEIINYLEIKNLKIRLITNGRAFFYKGFCDKLKHKNIDFLIKIFGHNKRIHDSITNCKGSFDQTVKGIKNLNQIGKKPSILFIITEQNFSFIPEVKKLVSSLKIGSIYLLPATPSGRCLENFEKFIPRYSELVNALNSLENIPNKIFLGDIPKCILGFNKTKHFDSSPIIRKNKIKLEKCDNCRENNKCDGIYKEYIDIYYDYEINPINRPEEIAIELNYDCNLDCPLCFNQNYVKKNKRYTIGSGEVKRIIDKIPISFVSHLRFTGGEPLLRQDIFEILEYAKNKGFKIWLNTNGTLIDERIAQKLSKYVENILIPLNGYDEESEFKMTRKRLFYNKIRGISLLKQQGIPTVRCGTILTKENIENFEKFYSLALELDLDDWEVYRPVPNEKNKTPVSKKDMKKLILKLDGLNKSSNKKYYIVNALPFCVTKKEITDKVCIGAEADDGHIRFVIGPDGAARPSYYLNKKVGNIKSDSVEEIWNSKFMKDMRKLNLLPRECKGCEYAKKCRGGSRFAAKLVSGSYKKPDPLSNLNKKR